MIKAAITCYDICCFVLFNPIPEWKSVELTRSGLGESDWYDFKKDFPPADSVTDAVG
jgi:hypothetical protein